MKVTWERGRKRHKRNHTKSQRRKRNANPLTRPALQRANAVEEARLYADCRHHASVGDWREHGDLPIAERGAAALAACTEPGGTRRGADCGSARAFGEFQRAEPGVDQSALGVASEEAASF